MSGPAAIRLILACIALALGVALSGCAGISLQQIAREDPALGGRYVEMAGGEGGVVVRRAGRVVDGRRGMPLQPGDEVETAPGAVAVIRFPEAGEVLLDSATRVRIGSLEVLFGRILANVRGLFTASSENVVAGVEGTTFQLEIGRDRSVRVVVLDGSVTCRSRTGSWPPIRLGGRESLFSRYPNTMAPRVETAGEREIERIRRWAAEVANAPTAGYCCDRGRVFEALSSTCGGVFRSTEIEARRACVALEPGWCCAGGQVTRGTRQACPGRFYTRRTLAERACAPRQEPTGWCCQNGVVRATRRAACSGVFFADRSRADRACSPVIERRGGGRVEPPSTYEPPVLR